MNKRRKSIAIALACAMLVGTIATTVAIPGSDVPFGITVSAAEITKSGSCGENLTYTLDSEGTLTITGTGEMENYEWNGSPFYSNSGIKKVIIEDGVTSIGDSAFGWCKSLGDITIPDSVTSIGDRAFEFCTSLTDITIPDGVTSIGESAFSVCSSLTEITIPDSVTSMGDLAFYQTPWYDDQPDGVVYAGKVAYEYKGEMPENTLITLEEGTTGIADSAFFCRNLKSITIPDSVTSIGNWALGYNYDLDSAVGGVVKQTDFTIYGYTGTEAERYAKDNGFKFIPLSVPVFTLGDVTGDGSVDIADSLFVARADAGLATLTEEQKKAADVNKDGSADIADALMIARYDAQLITKL